MFAEGLPSILILTQAYSIIKPRVQIRYVLIGSTLALLGYIGLTKDYSQVRKNAEDHRNEIFGMIDLIEKDFRTGKILMDGGHVLSYYAPDLDITDLSTFDKHDPQFYERVDYQYVNIKSKVYSKDYAVIIVRKDRNFKKETLNNIIDLGYDQHDRGQHLMFSLR